MNTIKKFDAVAFQRKTRDEIDSLIVGMSYEKRKQMIERSVTRLRDRIKKIKSEK